MHPEIALSMAKELQWWTRRRFFYSTNNTFPGKQQSDIFKRQHAKDLVNVPLKHYYAFFDNVADKISYSIATKKGKPYHRIITGDGSPNTMYWNDFASIFDTTGVGKQTRPTLVAHHIAATLPHAKIIAILREPAARLYSSYLFFNRDASRYAFHKIVSRGIMLFDECATKKSVRECTYDPELKEQVGSTVNLMQGLYSVMLEDWFEVRNFSRFKHLS